MDANVSGETLTIDPLATAFNPGTARARSGGILELEDGDYINGTYTVGDNSTIELSGATFNNVHLAGDSGDGVIANNVVDLSSNTTATDLELSAQINFSSFRSLTLAGDFTNNGAINLNGSAKVVVSDAVDQTFELNGTGTIVLTNSASSVQGPNGQTLILGAGQDISGLGGVGRNFINLVNDAGAPDRNFLNEGHSTSRDTFYEIAIPLALLNISRAQLENDGIGVMIGVGSESAMDSIPHDETTLDADGVEVWNSSFEWGDTDSFTTNFARIGAAK